MIQTIIKYYCFICHFLNTAKTIISVTQPLNDCVIVGKLRSSSKERSWKKFHAQMSSSSITILNMNSSISKFFLLKTFHSLLGRLWPESDVESIAKCNVTSDDNDIISYVAGSVIRKLRAEL